MGGDYTPTSSAFALKWSPWTRSGDTKVASLAYLSQKYVGFRKVTLQNDWPVAAEPKVEVAEADSEGICLDIRADATLEWEDYVWSENSTRIVRGIICSPTEVHPFQIDLLGDTTTTLPQHSTDECGSTYSTTTSVNPISGKIIFKTYQEDLH